MTQLLATNNNKNYTQQYAMAQFTFWGSYLVLNIVFMSLWGANSSFFMILFILLSVMLGFVSHALRYLFVTYANNWTLLRTSLNLLWLLPVASVSIQVVLYGVMSFILQIFPSLAVNSQPTTIGGLLGYAMNYCIMLTLWCTIYLLRSEFYKRRNSEIAHWQLQAQLKENELQFLRSQINSHFIFNAINNLRTLILEDPEGARAGLADLSTLLRGLLQNNGNRLVTLREEIEYVRGYLALESLQFEGRLTTSITIDERLLTAKLPSLLMQTLVENAIKHGIAARRAGGSLRIDVSQTNPARWQIKVTNPLPEFQSTHEGNKIGLRNARQRLHLAFNEDATLNLDITKEVVATVEMPL